MNQEVLPKVLTDLRDRVEVQGMATYGKPLTTGDGRDSLQDAYEEALDLAVYLGKMIMERAERGLDVHENACFSGPVNGLGG